jgi:hypothetical protein
MARWPGLPAWRAFALVAAAALGSTAAAEETCASGVAALRRLVGDPAFPLRWIETGMEDGKPLHLTIEARAGGLHLQFIKAREGLWAAGDGTVCVREGRLVAVFEAGKMQAGPAAGWLLKHALQRGTRFELHRPGATELRVGTVGWRGRFAPSDE